ncbi:MAG: PAS domain S-box protein, partial [Bacteroidales bacterium]|nr:PAS domain S-box protein [Bacteroidales bacterium]
DHILTYLSPQVKDILGYTHEEALIKWTEFASDNPINEIGFKHTVKAIKTGERQPPYELELVKKNGEKIWVEVREFPHVEDCKTIAILGSLTDITERKRVEKALRESESQKQAILDGITTNLAFVNKNLEILWVNKASAISVGKSPEEMIGHKCYELWADPEKPCDGCPSLRAWKTRKSEHAIMNTPDGRVWDERGEPVFDQNGELIGMLEIAYDITERKQAEEEIRKLSTAVKQSPSVIAITDLKGNLEYVNPKFTELTGYSSEEVIGLNPRILKSGELPDEIYKELWDTISSGKEWRGEFHNKKKNGEYFWEAVSISPIFDKQGKITNYIKIADDITERKIVEEELKENFKQQKLLTEISYLFTKLGKFKENMNKVLSLLGEYTKVSRVYVFEDFNNGAYTKNTYEWCNENIEPQIDNLQEVPYKIIPSWKKILIEKGMVLSSNILELPQDLIEILEPQKIKSILVLSIYVRNQFFGFMGFDECEKHRIWDKSEIELLKTVTNIISMLFERNHAEEALKESEQRFRFIAENTGDVLYRLQYDTMTFEYLSPAITILTGYTDEEINKIDFKSLIDQTIIPGASVVSLEELRKKRMEGTTGEWRAEYKILSKGDEEKWLGDHSFPWKDDSGKIIGSTGILQNITERKQAEMELAKHREHLKYLIKERTDEVERSQKSLVLLMEDVNEINQELKDVNNMLDATNKELEAF